MGKQPFFTTGLKSIPTCVYAGVPMLAKPTTKIQPAAVKAVVLCLLFVLSTQASILMTFSKDDVFV